EAAIIAGKSENEYIDFIDTFLHNIVPIGCGLFCFLAFLLLSNAGHNDPATTLREFAENFLTLSVEDQTLFNSLSRRQIYDYSLQ
ncbi:deubiquitinase SseL, partial [Salmonella enterica subsp. enterica serovar Enteritidis]